MTDYPRKGRLLGAQWPGSKNTATTQNKKGFCVFEAMKKQDKKKQYGLLKANKMNVFLGYKIKLGETIYFIWDLKMK